ALIEPFHPAVVRKAVKLVHVDAAEAERDGMNAARGASRGAQAKATVEQGVVVLEAEVDPAALGNALEVALDLHVLARLVAERREAELGAPDVIVGQLVEIDIEQGDENH